MNHQLPNDARALLEEAAELGGAASAIAKKLLSSESKDKSADLLAVENTNILAGVKELAERYNFSVPDVAEDKDHLINSLLKLIILLEKKNSAFSETLFDESTVEEDEDDDTYIDLHEQERDLELAQVKDKFRSILIGDKFENIMFVYSQREMWQTMKPRYRSLMANMLIDEAVNGDFNYPEFWNQYVN
jgi:hypothetical protein